MNKFKKISLVVLTLAVLVSSFVISSFAMPSEEALEGASLPKVSFAGVRSDGEFYTGTDVMFPQIDTSPSSYGTYFAQISGNITGSVRSRWAYVFDDDNSNYPFEFDFCTENEEYDIIIDFPLCSLGSSSYGDIGWDIDSCEYVTNQFIKIPTPQNQFNENNFLITLILVDSRGWNSPDPNFVQGVYQIDLSLPSVNSLRQYLIDYTSITDLDYVSISRMVISTFNTDVSTFGTLSLQSSGRSRYLDALHNDLYFRQVGINEMNYIGLSEGYDRGYNIGYDLGNREGYSSGYSTGIEEGYNQGYALGDIDGYYRGYDTGYNVGVARADELLEEGAFGFVISSVEGFLSAELFPGFSFGLLLTSILGVCLLIWLLKVFAGG